MLFDNFGLKFSLANRSALFVCLCLGEGKNGGGGIQLIYEDHFVAVSQEGSG